MIENAPEGELDAFLQVYRKMGGQYEWNSGKLIADGSRVRFSLPFLETEVYPGFPTDLQSPLLAVLATVPGKSIIKENIFENRFKVCHELTQNGRRYSGGRKHSSCLWRKDCMETVFMQRNCGEARHFWWRRLQQKEVL